tara:strand:+ start:32 stop:454 length:423 start_codon:yes stop_codon:yes gene_type:complete
MANTLLSNIEINKINAQFSNVSTKDITIKQRQFNIEKLTPYNKVIYKNKKNKHKFYKYKHRNNNKHNLIFKSDPYKFKQIPSNIKETIINLVNNNNTCLSYISYKSKVPLHIIEAFIYKNKPIDNYDLYLILEQLDYKLN